MRTLTIGADNKEAVDAAQVEIFMTLSNQQQQVQQLYNASSTSLHVVVPDDKVGLIIGKGGLTVKDIQNRLNVKVVIPQQADAGSNPPVRTVRYIYVHLTITGACACVCMCRFVSMARILDMVLIKPLKR